MISLIEFALIVGTASLTAAGASQGWQLLLQSRNNPSPQRAPSRQADEASRPAAGRWHAPRHNHRHHVSCQMNYLTTEGLTSGTLIDLSQHGWRVVGERPVMRGATLSMHVYLPDQSLPLDIDAATVRWTNGYEFGIELTTLSPDAAARLSDYLQNQLPTCRAVASYELSPFSYN
ncbi:MAG: PilZ domain-containing protein [Nitrospirota bacterium]|nr:PilZ domain-containing protein [Nitrospirota bacterium]